MNLTLNHAILFLANYVGASDGQWTEEEMRSVGPDDDNRILIAFEEAADWGDRIMSGELNFDVAIDILKKNSREEQLECLVMCYTIALADDDFTPEETGAFLKIADCFDDITIVDILTRYFGDRHDLKETIMTEIELIQENLDLLLKQKSGTSQTNSSKPDQRSTEGQAESLLSVNYAFMFLAHYIGKADGEWSQDEMRSVVKDKNSRLYKAHEEIEDWGEKVLSGDLNFEVSINILKQSSQEERLECLVMCYTIANSDGVFGEKEKAVFDKILGSFDDVTLSDVIIEYSKVLRSDIEDTLAQHGITTDSGKQKKQSVTAEASSQLAQGNSITVNDKKAVSEKKGSRGLKNLDNKVPEKSNLPINYAFIFMANYIGQADGDWSKEEMKSVIKDKNSRLFKANNEASDWPQKIASGELNFDISVSILKRGTKAERLECLKICYTIANADGAFGEDEKVVFDEILKSFEDITLSDVLKEHSTSNRSGIQDTNTQYGIKNDGYNQTNHSKNYDAADKREQGKSDNFPNKKVDSGNSKLIRNAAIFIVAIGIWHFADSYSKSKTVDSETLQQVSGIENSEPSVNQTSSMQSIATDQARTVMTQYYDASNNGNLNAFSFFDGVVEQFISKTKTNPSEIQSLIDNNNEFLEKSSAIDAQSFRFLRTQNEIDYFDYWLFFRCYRVSKQQIQECRINVEVGFAKNGKIRSYVEKSVTDLVFKEPADQDVLYAYIIDPPSNVRSCPNTTCDIVAECSIKNEKVKIVSEEGNWALVETQNGVQGYLHDSQFSIQAMAKEFTSNVDKLRFRETPSFSGAVIREVSVGTKFTYLNEQTNLLEIAKIQGQELPGYWYRVRAQDGTEGWIHGCCVSGI
jgi:tellurite resistance protein/SH3-like domain-containing protein